MGIIKKIQNDTELFELMQGRLYTAVCSDVMDDLGYYEQAMRPNIRPIKEDYVVIGRAKTVLAMDIYHVNDNPYELEIKAIDSVKSGEVVVGCTNNSSRNSLWGELLSTATQARGGTGAVIDGLARDILKIRAIGFPVFAVGYKPVDSRGRGKVVDYDCPVMCGDVLVRPGDLIFGDFDGVLVIPKDIAEEVVVSALDKVDRENLTREGLLKGRLLADMYREFGVL